MPLKIPNIDRVGLVQDISRVLAERGLNIVSMEVELNTTYIETDPPPPEAQESILQALKKIPQVL
ncbi:MAG: ACT domain-containing protein, partial [Deltaproteobacteria bacterium]|nr:ACT domain-containing protein [Deltaproteobacteria bacterium]